MPVATVMAYVDSGVVVPAVDREPEPQAMSNTAAAVATNTETGRTVAVTGVSASLLSFYTVIVLPTGRRSLTLSRRLGNGSRTMAGRAAHVTPPPATVARYSSVSVFRATA